VDERSRHIARAVLLAASVVTTLIVVEIGLRLRGYAPTVADTTVQGWAAFDPELVWINRPGAHLQWDWGAATFEEDGSRRTRPENSPRPSDRVVLVLGCSFTQGLGLDDRDTFAWKLQERFPTVDVRNFGTSGYGTYQSLMRFRRFMREGHAPPKLVIFGFADFHGYRDRGTRAWMVTRGNARAVIPPHVQLAAGRLIEVPGLLVPTSALARSSVLWNLIETAHRERTYYAPDDEEQTVAVQRAVLLQMRDEVARASSTLLLANVWTASQNRPGWGQFFQQNGFHVAECVTDRTPFAHPDPFWSLLHADCMEDAIRREGLL
jgi:hypothetical protein